MGSILLLLESYSHIVCSVIVIQCTYTCMYDHEGMQRQVPDVASYVHANSEEPEENQPERDAA